VFCVYCKALSAGYSCSFDGAEKCGLLITISWWFPDRRFADAEGFSSRCVQHQLQYR